MSPAPAEQRAHACGNRADVLDVAGRLTGEHFERNRDGQ
jgi:hypothetical protein